VRKYSFEEVKCGKLDGACFQEEYQGSLIHKVLKNYNETTLNADAPVSYQLE
jgi:hypothetical protein